MVGVVRPTSRDPAGGGVTWRGDGVKPLRAWSLLAPLAVCALLAGWIVLSVAHVRGAGFSIFVLAVANLVVFTDAIDFALRLYMRRRHTIAAGGIFDDRQTGRISINLPP